MVYPSFKSSADVDAEAEDTIEVDILPECPKCGHEFKITVQATAKVIATTKVEIDTLEVEGV